MGKYMEVLMAFGAKVVDKRPLFGRSRKKNGGAVRLGTRITDSDGEIKTLLTPAGKAAKYVAEISNNMCCTNDGEVKFGKNGKPKRLTAKQKAYRAGYLDARKDNAKVYNHNNK